LIWGCLEMLLLMMCGSLKWVWFKDLMMRWGVVKMVMRSTRVNENSVFFISFFFLLENNNWCF
jgi:hypothetical protein